MNINEIRKLIKLVESSSINELEIQEENLHIRIAREPAAALAQPTQGGQALPVATPVPVEVATHIREAKTKPADSDNDNTVQVLSPMVGTFYLSGSPDAEPFVKPGDAIAPGRILCIIEAMKLMNEIEAELSGKIVRILVENAQPVEFNQPLFLVERA